MRMMFCFSVAVSVMSLAACTHLKGVVLEDPSQRPLKTAVLTVGRPNGIAVYDRHPVDKDGMFDFQVGPTDENNIYIYDAAVGAEMTMRRIDRTEMSDHMKVRMRPAPRNNPALPVDVNINPGF